MNGQNHIKFILSCILLHLQGDGTYWK